MGKHGSTGRPMGLDIVLGSPSSGNADAVTVERIEVGPALRKSRVTKLHGRPYPVQFRNQGAFDAWKQALGSGQEWTRWADPEATCWRIRQEIQQQLNDMRVGKHDSMEAEARAQVDARMQAISISANLKYELEKGAIIEATPALETLLLNSDMDLDLPMKMVAPPYPAQYLKFGPEAARHLKAPDSDLPDRLFDGVFCFFTPPSSRYGDGIQWTLELIFISQRQDCFCGQVALLGTRNGTTSPWANGSIGFSIRRKGGQSRPSTSPCTRRLAMWSKSSFTWHSGRHAASNIMNTMKRCDALPDSASRSAPDCFSASSRSTTASGSGRMTCPTRTQAMRAVVLWHRIGAGGTSGCSLAEPENANAS